MSKEIKEIEIKYEVSSALAKKCYEKANQDKVTAVAILLAILALTNAIVEVS